MNDTQATEHKKPRLALFSRVDGSFVGFSAPFSIPTRVAYAVFKDGRWQELELNVGPAFAASDAIIANQRIVLSVLIHAYPSWLQ